jgi:hypothetical protein
MLSQRPVAARGLLVEVRKFGRGQECIVGVAERAVVALAGTEEGENMSL